MLDISFNGILASSLNLVPKYTNRSILPVMNERKKDISSKDGFYDYEGNTFKERIITIDFSFKIKNYSLIKESLRSIAEWLYTSEQKELFFTDEHDKYYLARVYHMINFEEATAIGSFKINFTCQPWAFSAETTANNSDYTFGLITTPQNISFYNPGNKNISLYSSPGAYSTFRILGYSTNLVVSLNGYTLTHTGSLVGETLEIDNIDLTIEKGGVNILTQFSGAFDTFLPIIPRTNILAISGTGLSLSIEIVFRPEWK